MMLKKVRFKVREGRKKSKVLFQVLFDIELKTVHQHFCAT